ncbi:hypothetical protein SPRG_20546 [Saprolegnia parasitica CBS 223.65]|uniref:Purple acid phosphatase n=1 Tax=Saprolegnia parasitica (strain CBS 223.65) TaxID=695850 RepID=A0A067C7M8_SAPPC|nr:hypothetical protein SPRG_20546 [Saprolegnia parasitica CBS 223.65]KDO26749.1 hypothetical protein SPRG_20546 [Saprolegnia parasitica CBS 223.65]|eukprot:XP_012202628.1 hypothetical protein SPRG_20546 [Saprolegnia parasitica CBS 223.65]
MYGAIERPPTPAVTPVRRRALALAVLLLALLSGLLLFHYIAVPATPTSAAASMQEGPESQAMVELHVRPQQLHLAYAGVEPGTAMTVSWTTYHRINDSAVWFADHPFRNTSRLTAHMASVASYYADEHYTLYTYHVTLPHLLPKTRYYYQVGSLHNVTRRSSVYHFRTARPSSDNHSFEMLMYADFGEHNAEGTVSLVSALADRLDFIWHVGDLSYADNAFQALDKDTNALGFVYEKAYNAWMNSLEPTMHHVPYMTTVGNHEAECYSPACVYSEAKQAQLSNFSAFNTRFRMPSAESNGTHNMWYSWNHGPVHFISISSESDFEGAPSNNKGTKVANGHFGDQLAWLEADLKAAVAMRHERPWILVGSHRPIYGLKVFKPTGHPKKKQEAILAAFEPLFLKYQVDMVVSGHQHAYERHLPIANRSPVLDGVSDDRSVYLNPGAPVYMVSGACGSAGGHEPYDGVAAQTWNVMYDNVHYGVSLLKANRSVLSWSFIDAGSGLAVDTFEIRKE